MTRPSGLSADLAKAFDAINADVVHVGLFDFAGTFRERRLRRAELLSSAETAMFAHVLPKWDMAE